MKFLKTITYVINTYQRKNGNQQRRNAPIIMPNVLAALCSARQLFVCCRIDVPETQKYPNFTMLLFRKEFQII